MSESYDIFLSHSGAQKDFVKQLYGELKRQPEKYSVFYDEDSIKHGDLISSTILEYAKNCKLAVAVLSDDYFTRSKPPMLELAASYTASMNGNGVPCLLPVFLELRPDHVKNSVKQKNWIRTWGNWKTNEMMSRRISYASRRNKVEPQIWEEALYKLLDTRGPVYEPHTYRNTAVFAEHVARVIGDKLDELLNKTMVPYKAKDSVQQYKAPYLSDSVGKRLLSEDIQRPLSEDLDKLKIYSDSPECNDQVNEHRGSPLVIDRRMRASTSREIHKEFERTSFTFEYMEHLEYKRDVSERQRLGEVRDRETCGLAREEASGAQSPRSRRSRMQEQPSSEDSDTELPPRRSRVLGQTKLFDYV